MFQDKKVLAIIPARGGSKGLPRKNILELGGKPLIAWSIDAAKRSDFVDRVVLSSDDEEIIQVARAYGCDVPFVRPEELAQDGTPGIDPVLHAVNALDESYDLVVLLQPTSPLRSAEDIDGAIRRCVESGSGSCVSVMESGKHPAWMYRMDAEKVLNPILTEEPVACRQELDQVYVLNGAVYAIEVPLLFAEQKLCLPGKTVAYAMPSERSVDIDTRLDFKIAEALIGLQDEKNHG